MLSPFIAALPDSLNIPVIVVGMVWSVAWALYGFRMGVLNSTVPQGDVTIRDAVDYLVNGTSAKIEQRRAPYVETVGVVKGRVVVQADRVQQDALRMIEEQLALGALAAFGRRAIHPSDHSLGFDAVRRMIPKDYWEYRGLHVLHARIPETALSQTVARRSSPEPLHPYTDILLNVAQVRTCWKPRSLFSMLLTRRIADPILTRPTKVLVEATAAGQSKPDEGLRKPGERFFHEFEPGEKLSSWMRLASEQPRRRDSKPDNP